MAGSFLRAQSIKRKQVGRLETYEQQGFVKHARMILKEKYKRLLFSIPNGGKRSGANGRRIVAEGLVKGVMDLMVAVPHNGYAGLFIEMKRINQGKKEDDQIEMAELFTEMGYKVVFCEGEVEAMEQFVKYMKGSKVLKNQLINL